MADAGAQPYAVVVEFKNAVVALSAVSRAGRSENEAGFTKFELKP